VAARRHVRVHVVQPTRFGVIGEQAEVRDCASCGAPVYLPTRVRPARGDHLLCVVCAMSAVRVGHTWTIPAEWPDD
jgi:hypothetical protein